MGCAPHTARIPSGHGSDRCRALVPHLGGPDAARCAKRPRHAEEIWAPWPTLEQFPLDARAAQAGYIWAYFAWKPLVPLHLAPVYTTLVSFRPSDALFVASVLGVGLVTVWLFFLRRRMPGLFALWLFHLVLLVPVLGLTEHPHYANDRYGHLPALLWSIALAVGVVQLWPSKRWRRAAMALTVVEIGRAHV